ncbi:MAG TPA: nuclear transport factor 2 family protein [Pyrinomonadaceae bacterium]
MRRILFVTVILIFVAGSALGQSVKQSGALEQEIKRLDLAEADAIQRKDMAALNKLLAEDFTVNNPRNEVIKGREEVYALMRNGTIAYSSFVREPEALLIYGNTVVVMGREVITLAGNASGAEQTVRRRYTNIWMKKKGKWLLTARHASVICQN